MSLERQHRVICSPSAFTLLEIILVVLVLTIIAGLTSVNFKPALEHYRLFSITDDLAHHMRFAQSRAVSQNRLLKLEFKFSFQSYRLLETDKDATVLSDKPSFQELSGTMGAFVALPQDIKVTGDKSEILFYPDGSIDKEALLVCRYKRCYGISTKMQRGFVKVFEVADEE